MKNILKTTLAAVAAFAALTACQEFEDYGKTIDGSQQLIYANTGTSNLYQAKIVHRPSGSTGEFYAKFGLNCNAARHAATKVTLVYDASLVEAYNAEHQTTYAVLPEEYLALENPTLTLEENAMMTADSVEVSFAADADLAALTELKYLAPLRLQSDDTAISSAMGAVYLAVDTEINRIRPISTTGDMVGFPATGRSSWTADCADYANLFDDSSDSASAFESMTGNVVTIDMKEVQKVTGLQIGYYYYSPVVSVEYSTDGRTYLQAGTPASDECADDGSNLYIAFDGNFEARYLRLSIDFTSSWAMELTDFNIYKIDSDDPNIYALVGSENVITGKVIHKNGTSKVQLDGSFSAHTTVASAAGYSVNVAMDASLVAAYNAAHGTSYAALPAANLQLTNTQLSIAANAYKSETETTVALTGDLSSLSNKQGYLVPLKLSASGAASSASRGVVYVVVKVEYSQIQTLASAADIIGFDASGRSSWTADCTDGANLFDGSNSTRVNFSATTNTFTIDMQQRHMITGLHFNTYSISSMTVEYSTDGQTFESAGTTESGDAIFTGSSYSAGDYYVGFTNYLGARYLRLTVTFGGYYKRLCEVYAYEIESENPTIYTTCGTDNVLEAGIAHTPAGSFSGSASFNVFSTIASASGYSVSATVDNSLVSAYNKANGTSYATLPIASISLSGVPCSIAANANKSEDQITVSLTGDVSGYTNANGYLIPVKLAASGAETSASRGTVYVVVMPTNDVLRKNFSASDIEGTPVADRSAWKILAFDDSIYSGSYDDLFDGDTKTYIRTWGGPIDFTVDLGKEYDMTGLVITARTDDAYSQYQPNNIAIAYSLDGDEYTQLGSAATADGNLVSAVPSSYVALYGSQKVRYLKITASYGSNMGTSEFNIYAK